jgi:hypothetical protein
MEKSLRKPENWQDFETLCKKLWGEVYGCPHQIKKNGRPGQSQNGVDLSCVPKNEDGYYGIQCKKKDQDTNAKITSNPRITERQIKVVKKELDGQNEFKPLIVGVNDSENDEE